MDCTSAINCIMNGLPHNEVCMKTWHTLLSCPLYVTCYFYTFFMTFYLLNMFVITVPIIGPPYLIYARYLFHHWSTILNMLVIYSIISYMCMSVTFLPFQPLLYQSVVNVFKCGIWKAIDFNKSSITLSPIICKYHWYMNGY